MTEGDARFCIQDVFSVPRETVDRLDVLAKAVILENANQNLISRATEAHIWERHILDSVQLVPFGKDGWIDLGSGPGFPGLVVAAVTDFTVTLVESRTARVTFLRRIVELLELKERVEIYPGRLETLPSRKFSTISARAFAPLPKLLDRACRLANSDTQWILPKGRSANAELDQARVSWQGDFRIEPSVTDPEAGIIIATNVRPGRAR